MNAKQRRVMRRKREREPIRLKVDPPLSFRAVEIIEIDGVAFYRNLAGELVELPF